MSDQVELQTEDLELNMEGFKTSLKEFFSSIFRMGDEKIVIDFEVPGMRFIQYAGINTHDGRCVLEHDNPTVTYKGVVDDFWLVFANIEQAAKQSGGFVDKPYLIKAVKTNGEMINDFLRCLDKKAEPRTFRVPKEVLEAAEKNQLPKIAKYVEEMVHKHYRNRKPTFYDVLCRVLPEEDAKYVDDILEHNLHIIKDVLVKLGKKCYEAKQKNLSLEEADVEVPETQAEAQPSTNIEVTLPERMDGVKKQLDLYAYLIKYLQQYKQDPHKTIGALMEDEQIPNREDFQDVKDALVGAFTSEKATILGCQKLVNLIETTAEAIRKDYVYLSNSTINSSVHDVISNINSIIETTDPGMLEKRKLMYRQNNVTLKYGNYKLEKSIQPYLQELSASMTMVDYLKRIRELQHSLKLDTLKDLEEKIRKYKYNNVFIANNNVYIGKSQFMKNIIEQDTTPPEEVSSLEAMKTFILKVDVSQDHDTVAIDILDNIIENFGNTLSGLKRSVEDFNKLLNSIGDASSKLTDTLDILTDKYIKPYADNTLLKDEFITSYQHCMQAMNNCLTNDKNIIIHILYSAHKLNVLLNNYSYIYSLLEKLTVEMTITEKSSISE